MLCSSNLLKKTRLSPCRGPCCAPGQTWPRGRCPVLPFSYPHCTCSLSGMSHPPHLRPFQRGTSRCLHLGRELIPRRKRGRLPRRAAGRAAVVSAVRAWQKGGFAWREEHGFCPAGKAPMLQEEGAESTRGKTRRFGVPHVWEAEAVTTQEKTGRCGYRQ